MNVCGLSILTRKNLIVRQFGGDAWTHFFRDMARAHACFRSLVTPSSVVPLPAFLAFHDELMRRFFTEDDASYARLGREASRWAVRDGPLKSLLEGDELSAVVASLPKFHTAYFKDTPTWSEAAITSDGVEFNVYELPEWHPYFEHFIVGYIAEILELFCANPIQSLRLEGGGRNQYRYLLHGGFLEDQAATSAGGGGLEVEARTHSVSSRELEALMLVARGRTNEQIGAALGISKKTVQHHVARAYRKLGVSGRVGAVMWLVEKGLHRN